jgi:predicted small lipoprotein YifL
MLSRLLLLAAAAAALAACGKQGELQRPPPLFGQPRAVLPADLQPGAANEATGAEESDEDEQNPIPAPNERTRPIDPRNPPSPAAPVNVPPTAR